MKLISCESCGTVLDADKLAFASHMYGEDGCIDGKVARYNQDVGDYQPYVPCPVCKAEVFKDWK